MAFDLKDYVEVKDRVAAFNVKFPEGGIQTEIAHLSDKLVIVKATVYRTPMDSIPSVAHSQMNIPGKTSFTKDSEVENAETSAVGRALAFLGFEVKKSLASADEVRNKQAPAPKPSRPAPADATSPKASQKEWMKTVNTEAKEAGKSIRSILELPDSANIVQELAKWQGEKTDEQALEEFRTLIGA